MLTFKILYQVGMSLYCKPKKNVCNENIKLGTHHS